MKNFSTDGIKVQVARSSDFGALQAAPGLDLKRLLYFFLLIPALMLSMLPLGIYPPLDSRLPMALIICAFLLSAVLQLIGIVQRGSERQVGWRRTVYIGSGLALPLLGILLFMNGKAGGPGAAPDFEFEGAPSSLVLRGWGFSLI